MYLEILKLYAIKLLTDNFPLRVWEYNIIDQIIKHNENLVHLA